ncbi:hypothetical protein [Fundidesulfovibrio terrae]|uniref:hypothetical protein n=1 Tax=Fundidesulfovibrio terrae TaxID=2922866 RepID=UPI001FAF61AC|nr:hypothetical protein [Fundidesulfovibrio terrae]
MSVTGITTQSLIASLGYLDIDQSQDTSDSSSLTSIGSTSATSAYTGISSGASPTSISQVGTLLSSLSKLEKSDPEEFKTRAKQIASDFNDAAGQCTDTLQSYGLKSMAAQFSNAGLSGSMSSINLGGAASTLAKAYAGQASMSLLDYMNGSQGTDFTGQLTSIMQTNLAGKLNGASF